MAATPPRGKSALTFGDVVHRAAKILARDASAHEPLSEAELAHICGRVCRGRRGHESDFSSLHLDGPEVKKLAWVVGADGLAMLFGRGSTVERLRALGFRDEWMASKLRAGEEFRLALFPVEDAHVADWDGVFACIQSAFPHVAPLVLRHAGELRTKSFAELEARAMEGFLMGATYFAINEAATRHGAVRDADPRYINTERLAALGEGASVEQVRGWLYFAIGLTELYGGDGWTIPHGGKDAGDGKPERVREYLLRNRFIDDFSAFAWVPIRIEATDFS